VAAAASRLATRNPEVLAQLLPSARAPYPVVWLEWNQRAQVEGTGFQDEGDGGPGVRIGAFVEQMAGAPSRYLLDLIVRDAFADGGQWRHTFVAPYFGSIYDTEHPLPDEARADEEELAVGLGSTRAALATNLLGSAYVGSLIGIEPLDPEFYDGGGWREHRLKINRSGRLMLSEDAKQRLDISDEELDARFRVCERLALNASLVINESGRPGWNAARRNFPYAHASRSAFHELLSTYSGFWGFVVSLLAMMANPELVDGSQSRKAGERRSVGAKTLPFLEHRVLKLRLTRQAAVERTVRAMAGRLAPRRHDVNGHWSMSRRRGNPTCDHTWVALTEKRQSCVLCEGLRWWVIGHERGDANRGYLTKDRHVTLD
jgi:hypothetical protein